MDKRVGVITLGVDDGVDDESDRTAFFQAPPTAGSRQTKPGRRPRRRRFEMTAP